MNELKPCPFCAFTNTRLETWTVDIGEPSEHNECAIMCTNCGAFGPNALTRPGAERMWNLRREPKEAAE